MNRLELRVGDGRLRHGREVVARQESREVLEQGVNEVGRRRNELRVAGLAAPPIQFCSVRTFPARGSLNDENSTRCTRRIDCQSTVGELEAFDA